MSKTNVYDDDIKSTTEAVLHNIQQVLESQAVTLRDRFACAALTGLCAVDAEYLSETWATGKAYRIADAMLKARLP